MKIGQYISELLYKYDAVTLPGFGTFETRYEPAKFLPEEKIVKSPSKIASFSPNPKHGETPLVHFVAEKEGKSHDEASKMLSDLLTGIEHALEAGDPVKLDPLGMFRKEIDGSLKFEPDTRINYLESYTGVSSIKTPEPKSTEKSAVVPKESIAATTPAQPARQKSKKEPKSKKNSITQKKRKAMTDPAKTKRKAKLPPALKWTAIILIPLLVILIIFLLNYNYFVVEKGLLNNILPIFTTEVKETTPEEALEKSEEIIDAYAPEDTPDYEPGKEADAAPDHKLTAEPGIDYDPYLEPAKPPTDRPVYFIIVGSFRNDLNAQNLALEMRKEGAKLAGVLDRIHSGYYRAYYGYYFDLNEAESAKARLDDELKENAWILHR